VPLLNIERLEKKPNLWYLVQNRRAGAYNPESGARTNGSSCCWDVFDSLQIPYQWNRGVIEEPASE